MLKLRQLNAITFTSMNSICICGAGTMGSGIAQVAARAGFRTILYDVNEKMIGTSREKMEKDLQALVEKQKILEQQKKETLGNILFTSKVEDCVADVIIEAIIEKLDAKTSLFEKLAELNSADTLFTTNTSSLSVSGIAREVKFPERVAGLHFFNPAPVMKLVEVVKADQTSNSTITKLVELTNRMGKTAVVCKDSPGFIVNRVARPYYIESLRLVEDGLADFETIDRLLESKGFRMGPFKLMDLIGNDVNYAVSCSVYEQLNGPERLRPSDIQKQKVETGELGKKTGKGYYDYKK
jgi:3-hydroxybutyryl-CoA dehydrogenase